MKTINLTHQQYIKAGVIIIATLLLGIFLFLMINNSENLVGEASRSTSVEQGTWLVLSLEKQRSSYQITKATTQNYNKEKYNKIIIF